MSDVQLVERGRQQSLIASMLPSGCHLCTDVEEGWCQGRTLWDSIVDSVREKFHHKRDHMPVGQHAQKLQMKTT